MSTDPSENLGEMLMVGRRPTLRDRLTVRLRSGQLDQRLGAGASPETDPALALRVRGLDRQRKMLAGSIRRMLGDSPGSEPGAISHRIGTRVDRVRDASDELARLADMLAVPGPLSPRGLALTWTLITDGTGPLYNPHNDENLRGRVTEILEHLVV
jgi:hypothetical protein